MSLQFQTIPDKFQQIRLKFLESESEDLHSPGFGGEGPVYEAESSHDDEHNQQGASAVYS